MAHGDDAALLHLQARSFRLYLDRDLVREIMVVENPQPDRPICWRQSLLRQYGPLADRVRFVDASELTPMPPYVSGWFSQQILKLLAARIIASDRYLVFDAKNHLVFPLTRDALETPDGTMRLYLMDYARHNMRPYLEQTLAYFGLAPAALVEAFVPTTTPFPLPAAIVRDLIDVVEAREAVSFAEAFGLGGFQRTEFFLFGAYLLASGRQITDLYDLSALKCPTIWPETAHAEIPAIIAAGEAARRPVFAVHRKAIAKLDAPGRRTIAAFWRRRGLFKNAEAGVRLLANYERDVMQQRRSAEQLQALSDFGSRLALGVWRKAPPRR